MRRRGRPPGGVSQFPGAEQPRPLQRSSPAKAVILSPSHSSSLAKKQVQHFSLPKELSCKGIHLCTMNRL
eukprot:1160745-Pelagomonas_calceolata.AAC.7